MALRRHRGRCAGAALRHGHRLRAEGHRRRQLGARAAAADARCARARRPADRHRQARAAAAAGGLHLRGLPQRRRLGGHAQHPGHHADRAVRGRRHRRSRCSASRPSCCRASRTSTTWSALEHGYGCGVAIDAPDAVVPIRTLRNISLNPNFGGEVMVVSLGCEKLQPERLLPPGSFADRRRAPCADAATALDVVCLQDDAHVGFMSMVDVDPAPGRGAPGAPERAPARDGARQRTGGRRAVRRQRRVLGRHRESGGRLLHRPAGARRRQRDVLRGHRGARRHRPAHRARRHARGGRGDDPRDGLVRRLPAARRRRPQRQHDAGQQAGRPVEHRRKGDGLDRQVGLGADLGRAGARREAEGQGPDLSPPRRPAISSAARCNWPPA